MGTITGLRNAYNSLIASFFIILTHTHACIQDRSQKKSKNKDLNKNISKKTKYD